MEHRYRVRRVMSVSIAILKILASCPDGRASFASLKADMAMLASPEWSDRMRTLGRRVGPINLFSQNLARRDATGWAITPAGRAFLERLESDEELPLSQLSERPILRAVVSKPASERTSVLKRAWLKVAA